MAMQFGSDHSGGLDRRDVIRMPLNFVMAYRRRNAPWKRAAKERDRPKAPLPFMVV